jgi:hypothetical protein
MFKGFKKYQVSPENRKGLAFGFTEKTFFTVKISQIFWILSMWDTYSGSVSHYSVVHKILGFLKYQVLL